MKVEKHYESKFEVGDKVVVTLERRYIPQDVRENETFGLPSMRNHATIIEVVFDEREREFHYLCELINREHIWLQESALFCA